MSRGNWNRVKHSKYFYVIVYRKLLSVIIISISLNIILCLAMVFCYLHRAAPLYYATSGIVPPVKLSVLSHPNYLSDSLLAPDPISNDDYRAIPD